MNDQLFVKSVATSKHLDWLKWLEAEELVEFFAELLQTVTQISEGKKDAGTLSMVVNCWHICSQVPLFSIVSGGYKPQTNCQIHRAVYVMEYQFWPRIQRFQ